MILQKQTLSDCQPAVFCLTDSASKEDILFFDIETTGFSPKNSSLYLIGAVYFRQKAWHAIQWLAETPAEESALLKAFFDFCTTYRILIHFNGEGFDIPYLAQKARQYHLPFSPSRVESLDLYRRIRTCKAPLKLTHMNQKALESFLGISRQDRYTGGKLIDIYHRYTKNPDKTDLQLLLLHNLDDVKGLTKLLPLLSYPALFTEHRYTIQNVSWEDAPDGQPLLFLELALDVPVPKPLSLDLSFGYLTIHEGICRLMIHAFEGELKYFLPDYRSYYYLPDQDCAIHKTIAAYTAPSRRMKATASTCYQRRYGLFLPQKTALFTPVFQKSYRDPCLWFECTEQFMNTSGQLFLYIKSLISF